MKISKIEIKDFHQFKDFTLDLTYPKGHEKEGKPLDKVCFIGQSGTGKTSLLELFPMFLNEYQTNIVLKSQVSKIKENVEVSINYGDNNLYSLKKRIKIKENLITDNLLNNANSNTDNESKKNKGMSNNDLANKLTSKNSIVNIIKVIGVGGAGNNIVKHLHSLGVNNIGLINCNTDQYSLKLGSSEIKRLQIGIEITKGLGAGIEATTGKKAAEESENTIREMLRSPTEMVFITAGMGGGTGTGAAPVIARIAKEMNILTIGLVTTPFPFEGSEKILQARIGIEELKKNCDTVLIIPNERFEAQFGDMNISEAFTNIDDILAKIIKNTAELITKPGIINFDIADVKKVLGGAGRAAIGSAEAEGENRIEEAIRKISSSPLFDNVNITGAQKVLVNITYNSEYKIKLSDQNLVTKFIEERIQSEAKLFKYGFGLDESLGKKVRITIIVAGFENDNTSILNEDSPSKLIYFPANLNYDLENIEGENKFDEKSIIDFSKDKISTVWSIILEKIQSFQEQEIKIRQEISKVVEKSSSDVKAIQEAVKKLEDWKATEFNPIQDVADNCLNALLANYKLRVKTELDFKTKDDIGFIKIEDYNGNEIPHGLWSTGTKQVILSALPLYLLKPKHTVILFDEPERSLYPDLQRTVVDYYTSLTTDCQFFYSTHSPIIASSFEPWEIVELKFNEAGKIYREVYFEGENHVDNYKWNPKFMRWDDILQRVFDLENDGSPARKEKLDELATLNVKYKKLAKKGEENSMTALEIIKKIEKLSKELSKWD
ncbi:MAG: cell division protein FtsZ [Emticicia sp.]|uniref:cell division protein FtsZ n=1 Tax=Emticicia sp. TaxID=1930953 RepID=UPI003BA78CBD